MPKPTIAVSACLLGQNVRYDGHHKREPWLTNTLSAVAILAPICPEVELGLGTPREPIQLEREGEAVVLRKTLSRTDLTQDMLAYADQRIATLAPTLSGYICKSKSPSCGLASAKISASTEGETGSGLFTAQLLKRSPQLPIIEETNLSNEAARTSFLTRVFSVFRLREFWAKPWTVSSLATFHHRHKLLLLAYSPAHYQRLNALFTEGASALHLRERYQEHFVGAFTMKINTEQHVRALQHAASYFHGALSGAGRLAIQQAIQSFRDQGASLQAPLQLISAEARRCQLLSLTQQHYFEPFPRQLLA